MCVRMGPEGVDSSTCSSLTMIIVGRSVFRAVADVSVLQPLKPRVYPVGGPRGL
jgi:hypothetical protein